jgi:2-amino-4-hydroxy-6-hydroxymethyldihydropteridine diphosphokinase
MNRVADLLQSWAPSGPSEEPLRWRAAGFLHDALRDGDPQELRKMGGPELDQFSDDTLHGPAAAARLRAEGVRDEDFLRAIAYHTIGHPQLDVLGRAVYAADFLEPGRPYRRKWRKSLRDRMPEEASRVLVEVARARIEKQLGDLQRLPEETRAFWNVLVADNG